MSGSSASASERYVLLIILESKLLAFSQVTIVEERNRRRAILVGAEIKRGHSAW
jgi:hypothetical protein